MSEDGVGMADTWEARALRIGEAVRSACVRAALAGYEQARMDGLCDEGALEVAIDSVRSLDIARLVKELSAAAGE